MFYDTGLPKHSKSCQPGESCGKYAEIWNNVFMQFNKTADGKYEPLKQKNVDTGMGVERTTAVLQGKNNAYETDLFAPIMEEIKSLAKDWDIRSARIIADHLRAATFLIADGVTPSNVERGYVLRRLIRRSIRFGLLLGIKKDFTKEIAGRVIEINREDWPEVEQTKEKIFRELPQEEAKFRKTLEVGIKQFEKLEKEISGKEAFDLYQTYGFPLELTLELAKEQGKNVDTEGFNKEFKRHQEISRSGAAQRFAGGLVDTSDKTIRGHTATHLLHQALRDVLGESVHQTGSNITPERIRFDFSHPERLADEQIKRVEELVNQKIKEDLPVEREIMNIEEAKKTGAIGLFEEKYGEKVSVYSIGNFSKEICGGPHVEHTGKIGKFKIIKEEALGAGQRRIRAVLE
jgi:alanyl-tRNA synthetase